VGQRRLRRLTKRARGLLDKPLREAQAAGIVRPDLRMDDLHILFTMVEGAVQEADTAGRRRIGLRALDLLFRGVAQPGQWTARTVRVDQVSRPENGRGWRP
jgi:hypothetical protein